MGDFISLTPWSDLFHCYQYKKWKMVLKGVNPSFWNEHNQGAAIMELGHILSLGRKSLWIWTHKCAHTNRESWSTKLINNINSAVRPHEA